MPQNKCRKAWCRRAEISRRFLPVEGRWGRQRTPSEGIWHNTGFGKPTAAPRRQHGTAAPTGRERRHAVRVLAVGPWAALHGPASGCFPGLLGARCRQCSVPGCGDNGYSSAGSWHPQGLVHSSLGAPAYLILHLMTRCLHPSHLSLCLPPAHPSVCLSPMEPGRADLPPVCGPPEPLVTALLLLGRGRAGPLQDR